jgi:ribosomal-protein-alanine N-acetyltransferase
MSDQPQNPSDQSSGNPPNRPPNRPGDAPAPHGLSMRPATEDDVAEILRIEQAVHAAPWTQENILAELAKPYAHFLIMTDDETDSKVASYICYWVMFEECHILNVAVDLPFRRLGLAKGLVRTAAREALRKNIRKVLLDVRKSNENAALLYQGLGFVITHIRKSFYSDGEDAYQMALYMDDESTVVDF